MYKSTGGDMYKIEPSFSIIIPKKLMDTALCKYKHSIEISPSYLPNLSVRIEVLTAVTMKNAVFWDIKTQFILHSRYITSQLQSPAG
jgi:hypothetical protein